MAKSWPYFLDAWLKLVPGEGRYTPQGQVTALADLTAAEYINSDRLDLDHLSVAERTSGA